MPRLKASESQEQMAFVDWFRRAYPSHLIMHIPNGERRDARTGSKLKRMGVLPGVPDLFIPELALWVEMKGTSGGRLSKDQERVIGLLEIAGYDVIVAHGWEDARRQVTEHLQG